ncbi:4-(cytidine 5'-diphospho)-2-C-methyl-D-erythritol kinase [Salipaludibacillus agaradhaerens]|uniref:4-diphosphocytidyl-2-C-methyl-D-erythritol kinase n=1 Tax=Salipaludibacillus agaradhaerens TaxID=76935 RepID=A0A9Q4B4Y6_SALAG|nr:4-(cytidine 5'-diphospho)-2-C-methyl-D-erythritol kinase [Salipaludibacillus agaradhaerens]MCR6098414.1 4-(cytidine 5'-diphospho)-2-C-methyl-D-erythritol kinase [Salipaludibacillus agaradhaerens]MCR6115956.1 4-(cytidine 5'-diphospho)-2-C-methyl-D-erythritol kinase [Salipaludibacillus agaradhaerens]
MERVFKAPAKINLTLDVLGKREDGYHEVEMVMTTVDLADRIHLKLLNSNDIRIEVNKGHVPANKHNHAYQAAYLLKKAFNIQTGVAIFIDKKIPVSAGLAGGSTDAAAVLRGLNEMWNLGLSLEELASIGLQIGSDVPFCVYGGTAVARGRGEKLSFISTPPPSCWVILAKTPAGVSTKDIYGSLQLDNMSRPDTAGMIQAIEKQDFNGMCQRLENVMEPATFKLAPEVNMIKEKLIQFGADGTVMSGSGPTVFSLTRSDAKAERLYNGLKGFMEEVFVVRILGERCEDFKK